MTKCVGSGRNSFHPRNGIGSRLRISPAEFDEVAAELARTLDFFKIPKRERDEVLTAFAAHKSEVTTGYAAAATRLGAPPRSK